MQVDERARKNVAVLLQGIAETGQDAVAKAISRDVSTVSRMKDGEFQKFCTVLAVCGLKVVPQHFRCSRPEAIQALETLARIAMNQQNSLVWDDD